MSNEPEPVALKGQGVVSRRTTGTVAEALERLLGVLKARGVKVSLSSITVVRPLAAGQHLPNTPPRSWPRGISSSTVAMNAFISRP